MKSADNAFDRTALIILDKDHIESMLQHVFLVIGLHKITPVVAMDSGGNDAQALNALDAKYQNLVSERYTDAAVIAQAEKETDAKIEGYNQALDDMGL